MNVTVTYGEWGYKLDRMPGEQQVDASLLAGDWAPGGGGRAAPV